MKKIDAMQAEGPQGAAAAIKNLGPGLRRGDGLARDAAERIGS